MGGPGSGRKKGRVNGVTGKIRGGNTMPKALAKKTALVKTTAKISKANKSINTFNRLIGKK